MHREGALVWNTAVPQNQAFRMLYEVNGVVSRMLYHVGQAAPSPIPTKGALLVCDHTSYSDALALLATTNMPAQGVPHTVHVLSGVRFQSVSSYQTRPMPRFASDQIVPFTALAAG
jgi:hypothetical protein